jgi:hypothetical protein
MGLSRLDNFLKSARGTILYVDPSSLDSTDSIENSGNSLTRPFKTIQRALIEAARFSYQRGLNNDRFNKTTILLYPGDHFVDNRPGYIPTPDGTYIKRSGISNLTDFTQWTLDTRFDLTDPDNPLYKLNSIYGGLIVPRGTSIVGMDLRKTKIRPLYVPNPENEEIERSCVFRTTGACYFWQFTILDSDPNGTCYKDYTDNIFVPNFSHHKLSGFEYADGVNPVVINDDFLTYSTTRTDLDMYYEKIAAVYGPSSEREIEPDYGQGTIDIQPVIDEYRIVGPKGDSIGISSIRSGDGIVPSTTITVDLIGNVEGLNVDTPVKISGVGAGGYDGQYVVYSVLSDTQIQYKVQNAPLNPLPGVTGSTLELVVDTVTSASPYIFNISLRSVYGMCGLLADGDKATGFKSMVVAQYTGIGLQKDDNAFVRYDSSSRNYKDSTTITNLNTDSRSKFKPEYENFHIKATNDAFLQLVSVFAIGYAQHFVTENGGDIALNNSNSNFGSKALVSSGFKRESFSQDDSGYITNIIPPKEIENEEITIEFASIDVGITTQISAGAGTTTHLYLYQETNRDAPPSVVIDGYNIGAKKNEQLKIQTYQSGIITTYSSNVVMPSGPYNSTLSSSEKYFTVDRSVTGINSISANTLTLTEVHSLINGEKIRIIADDGNLPDGLESNEIYYAITKESAVGIETNQIRIAKTLSNAVNGVVDGNAITINNKGGRLRVVSRVSDKNVGDIGHPVQWNTLGYWYINVDSNENQIYNAITSLGVNGLGDATSRSYVSRKLDYRSLVDTLYRVRYVLPKNAPNTSRPPSEGFIIQESNNIIGTGSNEISQLYNPTGLIANSTLLRNPKFIANISWSSGTVTVRSEIPHQLVVGEEIQIVNALPSEYNGTYIVTSVLNKKEFTYDLVLNPGIFGNNTSDRNENLPYFRKKKFGKIYQVYKSQEIQKYIPNVQDGVYYLTLISNANNPTVVPFREKTFNQPIERLYPQINKDNPNSDPDSAVSHSLPDLIGKTVINDPQKSITKETLESFAVGYGITDIKSSSGTAHTIYTSIDHGFSGITTVSIVNAGIDYGTGDIVNLYNAQLVGFAGSITGSNATARISLGSNGEIIDIAIIDGGSSYGIGNTLSVVGVATTGNHIAGVVRVESITNNVGNTFKISGVSSITNSEYDTYYRISSIETGKPKEINVISFDTISSFETSGIGSNSTSKAKYYPSGEVLNISNINYNSITGLATVGFTTSHGFHIDNKINISGANESVFNGDFIVNQINNLTSLVINVGTSATTSNSASGTLYAHRPILTSYGGDLFKETENTSGRLNFEYYGITATLGTTILTIDPDSTTLNIPGAVSLGFKLGDYLLIDNEIFRIKGAVNSDSLEIFRSILGSPRENHFAGSVVRKIRVTPVELRRNSIIRASGHTFEYLGYGPGNYSTSLPDKQDRLLSNFEKLLAQSTKYDGGIVVYTGMDSEGNFYAGNKKINSATGTEETFDTPYSTNTSERETNDLVNITDTQKLFVNSSIKVEGGVDKNIVSEFDGPVVFNSKITSNSDIETSSILIQGEEEVSRRFSIKNEIPTISGNYGDVVFNSETAKNDFVGWTYITENKWEPFGWVGYPGVGIEYAGNYVGFSTLVNLVATGFTFTVDFDSESGISTLTWDADPRIGIYTGLSASNFLGRVTNLNFVGGGITVTGDAETGIATIILDKTLITGSSPGEPYNSFQWNNNDIFSGQEVMYFDPNLNQVRFGTFENISRSIFFNDFGSVGFGTTLQTSKLEIVADNERSIYIKSTSGSEIVRIENVTNDTTPFVIDENGYIGINTDSTIAPLDVVGDVAITGIAKLYELDRTNYVGFQVGSLSSNLTFTLPNSYGMDGYGLRTNGSGLLYWGFVSSEVVASGPGITITKEISGDVTTSTIRNVGVTKVIAGEGISINGEGTGEVTINVSDATKILNPYPYTTRGFSIPV